jgi:hypothetical protein
MIIQKPYELWIFGIQNFGNAAQSQLSVLMKKKRFTNNRETRIIQVLVVIRRPW